MPPNKNTSYILLFFGDILLLSTSLYLTLTVRYWQLPTETLLSSHFTAFSVLFAVWTLVFFVAGLYDRETLLLPESLWQQILKVQMVNSFIAVIFFYTIPFFAIAPKTNLFIYLVISSALLVAWRYWARMLLSSREPFQAILIASGPEARELQQRMSDGQYGLRIQERLNPDAYTAEELYVTARQVVNYYDISFVILDRHNKIVQSALARLHAFLYANVHFLSIDSLYESVFNRVPITRLQHEWFIEHIRHTPHAAYDALKRGMDIVIAGVLFVLTAPFYPLIGLAIWLEDGGPIFYLQERLGQFGKIISIRKFRTMTTQSKDEDSDEDRVTGVGWFLRKTRIDELPQLINVLDGDLSLIGPRPEIPRLATNYAKEIPYYNARHLIKPGLSGWAQLNQDDPAKFTAEVDKTQEKLSYDLFYVKNRSLLLDIKIALWTLRVLASQSGK